MGLQHYEDPAIPQHIVCQAMVVTFLYLGKIRVKEREMCDI